MAKKESKEEAFNVLTEVTEYEKDEEEEARLAAKAEKKKRKQLSKEEKEAQRKINRENREKKKQKKELNKKRKRGELDEEEAEEEEKEEEDSEMQADSAKKDKKESERPAKPEKKQKVIEYGVWVGNLSYATTSDTIRDFFKECGEIIRLKCPKGNGAKNNNKGFAYVFFSTPEASAKAVALSEQKLEGRSLLIKDSENFERVDDSKPMTEVEKKEMKKQKNPPSPTLFLGNLSFDTTKESIQEHFSWAGEIRKVRLATFEDSGKCKGFAYVDYHEVEAATKAIRAPDKHNLDGRKIRVEFASAEAHMRSKPWLMRKAKKDNGSEQPEQQQQQQQQSESTEEPTFKRRKTFNKEESDHRPRERRPKKPVDSGRLKPGEALSSAQRQKPTVQEFKGTKVVFD
ncbi:Nucleolar protein 13 [Choanephora cucurbitarum]|uniref:Nucleolar protein 13 n=1 Tax=Choanephora cucurbitarum TaxID=101091 RepID=A0A1C7NNB4_9FUNG|nr:Nucleolar protein 13 [Choanephora cucurbitarum]